VSDVFGLFVFENFLARNAKRRVNQGSDERAKSTKEAVLQE
jgi:hypothetical protein